MDKHPTLYDNLRNQILPCALDQEHQFIKVNEAKAIMANVDPELE